MSESVTIEVTLDADVLERLKQESLWRGPRTSEEYLHHERTGEYFALSIDEFLNQKIRHFPTQAQVREAHYRQMVHSGAHLGDPEYRQRWREMCEE